jgi:hypothetical protein
MKTMKPMKTKEEFVKAIMPLVYQFITKYGRMEKAGIELDQHDKSVYNMALALHVLISEEKE